jgi:hypothetical protein
MHLDSQPSKQWEDLELLHRMQAKQLGLVFSNHWHKGGCTHRQDLESQQGVFLARPPRKLASRHPLVSSHSRSQQASARSGSKIKVLQHQHKMPSANPNSLRFSPSLSSLPGRLDLAASKILVAIPGFNSNQF